MQSFYAVADLSADFAITLTHTQNQHIHDSTSHEKHHNISMAEPIIIPLISMDSEVDASHEHSECHHCAHCSVPHVIWCIDNVALSLFEPSEHHFIDDHFAFSDYVDTTYRPPII